MMFERSFRMEEVNLTRDTPGKIPAMGFLLVLVLFSTLLTGCRTETPEQPRLHGKTDDLAGRNKPSATTSAAAIESRILLEQPLGLFRGETVADALPVWRRFAGQKPTLILLSSDPSLLPPPTALQDQTTEVLLTGGDAALRNAGNALQPAPLFLPAMAVDLALRHGWLRELFWIFPQRDLEEEFKLELLREQLVGNGIADAQDAAALRKEGKLFTGTMRDRPFHAAALPHLPRLDQPVIIHIDLSYFQKLYKNEIATPVIPLVGGVLQQLQEMRLPVLAVTFSYNHDDGNIPLDVRFLGEFISDLMAQPEQLDLPLSLRWSAQQDILYLANFFQKDKIRDLVEQQGQEAPDAAWVLYNLYKTAEIFKEEEKALEHLGRAVAIDPVYGREYLRLAERAKQAQQTSQALSMFKLASVAFPENPLIKLKIAEISLAVGQKSAAEALVKELLNLSWSTVYYRHMPHYLKGLLSED